MYWAVLSWEDVGGPEDGPIVHNYRSVYKTETAEEAIAEAKRRGEITYGVEPATEDEIAEYEYIQEQEREFEEKYGCSPYDCVAEACGIIGDSDPWDNVDGDYTGINPY